MPTDQSTSSQPTDSLKVLLITSRSDVGGGPRHILDLLRACEGRGLRFSIASPIDEPFASLFRTRTEKFFELPARKFSLRRFFQLARFIREEKIDIIHSHGRGAGVYSRPLGWLTGRLVVHTFHGVHAEKSLGGKVKLLLDQFLARFRFYSVFVSKSDQERGLHYHLNGNNAYTVIENAVDESRFLNVARPPRTSSAFRVGLFMRADDAKGPDLWINAVNAFLSKNATKAPVVTFTCAGVSREELKSYGAPSPEIEFAGAFKEPAPWLKSLDLYVSFSRVEGLPLGVLEAMACEVPCLLSEIPAHQAFVDHKAARSFESENPVDFEKAVMQLVSSETDRQKLTQNAKTLLENTHSLKVFGLKTAETYRSLKNPQV